MLRWAVLTASGRVGAWRVKSKCARPQQSILVLITDLYEGGNAEEMVRRMATLAGAGVNAICLLALNVELVANDLENRLQTAWKSCAWEQVAHLATQLATRSSSFLR
jgi:hypothetical protein